MGDISKQDSCEMFIQEFGDELCVAMTPVFSSGFVTSFLEQHEVYGTVHLIIILRDTQGDDVRLMDETVVFDSEGDLEDQVHIIANILHRNSPSEEDTNKIMTRMKNACYEEEEFEEED